jgi:hypothetical protein
MEPLGLELRVRGSDHVQLILIGVLGIRGRCDDDAETRLAHALHGVTGWYSAVEGELAGRRDSQAGRVRGSSAADLGNRHANA